MNILLIKKIFGYSALLFAGHFAMAQQSTGKNSPGSYRAIHWGIEDGLSQGAVLNVIKGINGFLWIGTRNGLNRFDGHSFKKYYADKTKKNKAISDNAIAGLIEDSLYNIWIGTDKGLSCYNSEADSFTNFYSRQAKAIIPFWATKDEVFCWDYPESQLAAYNIHSFTKRTLAKISPGDSLAVGVSDRNSVFDAGSNSIWIEQGYHGAAGGGLLQISLSTGKKLRFGWPCYRNIPNHGHSFEGMRYDRKRNSIWIGSNDGLVEFTLNDQKFHRTTALDPLLDQKDFHPWSGTSIDKSGRVWIATYPKGIMIYDPSNNSVSTVFPKDSALQQEISDANILVYCDRDGITWCGSWDNRGIYEVIPYSPSAIQYTSDLHRPNSLNSDFVVHCFEAGQGKIWLSTVSGINIFDPVTGLFQVVPRKDLTGIPEGRAQILVAAIDTFQQKAWLQFDDSVYQMDMATKKCVPVLVNSDGKRKLLPAGFPTPYKTTCIITTTDKNEQGIFIINKDSAVAEQILSFPPGTIDFFKTATDDSLLFLRQPDSSVNLTYALRNKKWVRAPNPMDSIHWTKLIYNKGDRTYWLAGDNGIRHYNRTFRLIHIYTQQDGLPDHDVCGMIADNRNNIWFNTELSINILNVRTGRITTLSEKDGFRKQAFTTMLNFERSASGELYLPSGFHEQGFTRVNPFLYTEIPSSVYLESLVVNQKTFSLPAGISSPQELSLSYFENTITIEAGTIDFYSRTINHIRYKMEENAGWRYPAGNVIFIEGLSTGNYKLIIQASNSSNEYAGPEKILSIVINPPFWNTWWFRTAAMLVVIAGIYGFIQYRSRNLKQRNLILENKVTERTNELNHSLTELKNTQEQLVHSEKMASLGELTSGIAHEIKNPLNFINNFSEINLDLIMELNNEPGKEDENAQIIKTLIKNLEKINHHGKRVDDIVKSMLQHSRVGNLAKEPVSVNTLCDESLKLAYHGFKAKEKTFQASFETHFDPGLPQIMAIPQELSRVLLNLFNNAFYAVHEKKKKMRPVSTDKPDIESSYRPMVTVGTKRNDSKIVISISDNGTGIPQKIINKIFQPFFTTKPTGEGTGLGLSMSYDIITKSHGGELNVKSVEGEGTDFEVCLPAS